MSKKTICEHLVDMLNDNECRGEMTGYQLMAVEDIIELLTICPFDRLKTLAIENSKKGE